MKHQSEQRGMIGIVLQHEWFEPISNSTTDKLATERARSFTFNWYNSPIIAFYILFINSSSKARIRTHAYCKFFITMQVLGPNHTWKVPNRDGERSWRRLTQVFQQGKRETQERTGFHWHQLLHSSLYPRLHILRV